jgi:aminodeoxychorismate lyase
VPVNDRGFLYGDGLFETIRVCRGRPFRLTQHLERLARGAAFLKIHLPFSPQELQQHAAELISRNAAGEAILRLTLSRGVGERGYLPRAANHPTLVMTMHPAPAFDPNRALEWPVITASQRVPAGDHLAGFKSANKLVNVLARMEADEKAASEALLLNTKDEVVEAASSNLFWIQNGNIFTPPLGIGLLPGITRAVTMEICQRLGMPAQERAIKPAALRSAAGVFLTQSAFGVIAINALDGQSIPVPPQIHQLHRAYCKLLTTE